MVCSMKHLQDSGFGASGVFFVKVFSAAEPQFRVYVSGGRGLRDYRVSCLGVPVVTFDYFAFVGSFVRISI